MSLLLVGCGGGEGTTVNPTSSTANEVGSTTGSTSGTTTTPVTAGSATVSWVAPMLNTDGSTLTDLAGFRIYFGTNSASLAYMVNVTNAQATSYVVSGLTSGTWYFAVTSYSSDGSESSRSAVASKTI
jgi:hypothetical protein